MSGSPLGLDPPLTECVVCVSHYPGQCEPQTVCTRVGVWSIVSWRTWLALFPHVMTGRHMAAGHVVLWAARV